MNVDPTSKRQGEIVAWDSLTDAEQKSGSWLKLPTHDEDGKPVMARRLSPIEQLYTNFAAREALFPNFPTKEQQIRDLEMYRRQCSRD
jgi:hypothetical protein